MIRKPPAFGSPQWWSLGIWLFFLVQTLFFVVGESGGIRPAGAGEDAFERARREAERILARY